MYYIKSEQSFDAAHFLKGYKGKCANIHGHRWRVTCEVKRKTLLSDDHNRDMLEDFSVVKDALGKICDKFDHSLIFEAGSLKEETYKALKNEGFSMNEVPFRPTAEKFAEYFYEELKNMNLEVHRIEVFETPTNSAVYEE